MLADDSWLTLRFSSCTKAPLGYLSLARAGDFTLRGPEVERAAREAGNLFPEKRFLYCQQEHTRIVRPVTRADLPGTVGDGLVTQDEKVVLGITVADCLPILLWDPETKVRGLLHSGWKGTGILREAVSLMNARYGSQSRNLRVLLGPCIRSCCYQVDEGRAEAFEAEFGKDAVVRNERGFFLDLVKANQGIAEGMGVGSVEVVEGCTYCDPRFHSFRRQGAESFQRMLVLF